MINNMEEQSDILDIPEFELQLSQVNQTDKIDKKTLILSTVNKIRSKHGLPELTLAFFEESEHPRNHGRFIPKGGGGDGGGGDENEKPSFHGETYDREKIRAKIKKEDRAKKLHIFLTSLKYGAIAAGGAGLVASGHPILGAALVGGYAAQKIARKIKSAAIHATLKYATTPRNIPFIRKNIPQLIRGEEHRSWID